MSRVREASKEQLRTFHENYAEVPESQERFVEYIDGDYYCRICKKRGWAHLQSGAHLKRVEEQCLGDIMTGKALSTRRLECTNGMPGLLTKRAVYKFWGEAVENLAKTAKVIISTKGSIMVDQAKRRVAVPSEAIDGYEVGIVSYTGDGKYDHSRMKEWHAIPDSEDVIDKSAIEDFLAPEGQGWWPVILLNLNLARAQVNARGRYLLIYFYQLRAEELVAWWFGW